MTIRSPHDVLKDGKPLPEDWEAWGRFFYAIASGRFDDTPLKTQAGDKLRISPAPPQGFYVLKDRYVLKDGKPVPEPDSEAWKRFFDDINNRRVGDTRLETQAGDKVRISTVFLGIDLWDDDKSLPVLWETEISWPGNDKFDYWQNRYTSAEEARAGHEKAVALVKAELDKM